jgi:AraC-like DNA-binding protein
MLHLTSSVTRVSRAASAGEHADLTEADLSTCIPPVARDVIDDVVMTHSPAAPLSSFVELIWYSDGCTGAGHKECVLPNGRFQIVIDLSTGPGAVMGMRSQCIVIEPAEIPSVIGVMFRPGGARGFFQSAASDFYNQIVPLDAAWGRGLAEVRERLCDEVTVTAKLRLVETVLLETVSRTSDARFGLHDSVRYALGQFRRVPHIRTVMDVSRGAALSRRRLSQLFREQVGMTPKLYCRLTRFRRVVRRLAAGGSIDWADMASAGGYFDQAHMAHEFRDFSGLSPSAYLAAERPSLNHVRIG